LAKYFRDVLSTRFWASFAALFRLAQNLKFSSRQMLKIVFFLGFNFQFVILRVFSDVCFLR